MDWLDGKERVKYKVTETPRDKSIILNFSRWINFCELDLSKISLSSDEVLQFCQNQNFIGILSIALPNESEVEIFIKRIIAD